jgi:hypothetical protein
MIVVCTNIQTVCLFITVLILNSTLSFPAFTLLSFSFAAELPAYGTLCPILQTHLLMLAPESQKRVTRARKGCLTLLSEGLAANVSICVRAGLSKPRPVPDTERNKGTKRLDYASTPLDANTLLAAVNHLLF